MPCACSRAHTSPPATTSSTRIRFSVSVPVLSVQRTVAAPRDSIAEARRVSTRACEMRQAPIAINTARTSGISSGRSDIPIAMPPSAACNHEPRKMPNRTMAIPVTAIARSAMSLTNQLSCALNRGCSSVIVWSAAPILPISDLRPVKTTRAVPAPRAINVPANANGRSSPPGAPQGISATVGFLRTGTDSPVSNDSSARRSCPSINIASAGTRSPSDKMTRSPGTISRPGTRLRIPSRTTRARGLARLRSVSRTRSLRIS